MATNFDNKTVVITTKLFINLTLNQLINQKCNQHWLHINIARESNILTSPNTTAYVKRN